MVCKIPVCIRHGRHCPLPAERFRMGEKNNVFKVYMSQQDRIGSVLEYHFGEKLPQSPHCEEEDGFYAVTGRNGKVSCRQRDVFKKVTMQGEEYYVGIENQEKINLTMPWRILQMDCLDYERQLEKIRQKNIAEKAAYGEKDDYMYRMRQKDRLIPILNLVLYWGKGKWEKPGRLKDMLQVEHLSQKAEEKVADYPIYVINMRSIPEEMLERMDSDLKYVLGIMRYEGKGKAYQEYITSHREYFRHMPRSAVDVLDVCMNIGDVKKYLVYEKEKGEEKTDMCKALRELQEESRREGEQEGRREGRQEGEQRLATLIQKLLENGKSEFIAKMATNAEFRENLFEEYGL